MDTQPQNLKSRYFNGTARTNPLPLRGGSGGTAYEAAKNLREVGKMVKGWLSKNLDGLKRKFVGKPKPTEEKK